MTSAGSRSVFAKGMCSRAACRSGAAIDGGPAASSGVVGSMAANSSRRWALTRSSSGLMTPWSLCRRFDWVVGSLGELCSALSRTSRRLAGFSRRGLEALVARATGTRRHMEDPRRGRPATVPSCPLSATVPRSPTIWTSVICGSSVARYSGRRVSSAATRERQAIVSVTKKPQFSADSSSSTHSSSVVVAMPPIRSAVRSLAKSDASDERRVTIYVTIYVGRIFKVWISQYESIVCTNRRPAHATGDACSCARAISYVAPTSKTPVGVRCAACRGTSSAQRSRAGCSRF